MLVRTLCSVLFFSFTICIPGKAAAEERQSEPWQNTLPIKSWTELRTRSVVLQRLDFSCGAASLATISSFYLSRPVNEAQALAIIRARYSTSAWEKKRQQGLSLEDLSYIAENLGLSAQGGKIGLAGLTKLEGPVIVHLRKSADLQHFSVLRGIHGMTAYLADPWFGLVPMSLGEFVDEFTGVVLAVWDPKRQLPPDYILKLDSRDAYHDNASQIARQSLYERLRPLGPSF